MTLDSSSIDRRFACRECGRPRLRAVALITDEVRRAQLMAQPLCTDHHRPQTPEAIRAREEWEGELPF